MTERLTHFTPALAAHMVIRGTVIPGTTRCELYPIIEPKIPPLDGKRHHDRVYYDCFVDVRINDYHVGEGPPKLTVSIFGDSMLLDYGETYEDITDEEILWNLGDPHSKTVDAYEGREMILFLTISQTIAVETWTVQSAYFVQRHGEEIRVVSQSIVRARTPEQLDALDVEYTEFVRQLKEASVNRIALTGGRIGEDPSLPMLVTDANKLRDFYGVIGAVYDGDDATVLPPPAPGGDGPVTDPATTGDEGDNEGDPTGPGEDTTTSTTDETTTTDSGSGNSTGVVTGTGTVTVEPVPSPTAKGSSTVAEPIVRYLVETIPPCTPLSGSDLDPCITGDPPVMGSQGSIVLPDDYPTLAEKMLWGPEFLPHIVVRGTALPNTSRCGLYPILAPNTVPDSYLEDLNRRVYYYCFVDIRISEYIVGEGPSRLTVAIYRESLLSDGTETFGANELADEYLEGPSRTADVYEGKELVLFLGIPFSLAVEAWVVHTEATWFVQRNGDEIRAVSEVIRHARTPEHRARLNMPLSKLIQETKQAAQNRLTVTDGRTGKDPSLPMLVTDANKLRDFYGAVGAVYDGDDATVLPPPAPGGDGPVQDPATTGEEGENEGDPTGPGEETTPSPTDETTTTTSSTTSTTVVTTTSPTTTATTSLVATAPGSVRGFGLEAGDGNATATWQEPLSDGGSAITGYELAYRIKGTPDGDTTVTAAAADRSKVITPLDNGATYQIRIRALNSTDNGTWSNWEEATPRQTPTTEVTVPDQ
jgi:hypothetical protein